MPKVSVAQIKKVMTAALTAAGVPAGNAAIITDTAAYANVRGIHTHGIGRLPLYIKNIRAGGIDPSAVPELIRDDAATAVLDAKNGFGQPAARAAMELCIDKARQYGIGIAGVRRSNNFGAASYYGEMAVQAGMAGFVAANAAPAMAPTGGKRAVLGTNPLCLAVPGADAQCPVILDMATTVAARGKIRLAAKKGEAIPEGWAADKNGSPTTDAAAALDGTLLPIGGYKGYGLSLFVDIFAGMITGSSFAGEVRPLSDAENASGNGHIFVALDTARFLSSDEYGARIETLIKAVRESGEAGAVQLPGEAWAKAARQCGGTVELPQVQIDEINTVLGMYCVENLVKVSD